MDKDPFGDDKAMSPNPPPETAVNAEPAADQQKTEKPEKTDKPGTGATEAVASESSASASASATASQLEPPTPAVGINKSTTFPPRNAENDGSNPTTNNTTEPPSATRRRGATLSSIRQSSEAPDRLSSILENAPQADNASAPSIKSPGTTGLRERSASGVSRRNPPRSMTFNRAPTMLVRRPTGLTTGRAPSIMGSDGADIPGAFTLAGPDTTQGAQNQPYVDPAYAALNPAYVQPTNQRPVWGLAKPLPRVLRPGMVPTTSELNLPGQGGASQQQESSSQWGVDDIEKGKPSLRRAGTFQAVSDLAAQREARLLRRNGTVSSSEARTSTDDPAGRSSNALHEPFPNAALPTPIPETDEEDGDGGYFDRTTSQAYSFNPSARRAPTKQFDDASSDATEVEHEEDWPPLTSYGMQIGHPEDEVHNHHTHWSVIRTRYREPLAEFLGCFVQLTIAFCADLSVTVSGNDNNFTGNFAWGFASMAGIYIAGGISGAHLNPAISVLLYIYRGFPIRKIPSYVFAQVLAAFIAALVSYGLYRTAILEFNAGSPLSTGGTAAAFITSKRHATVDPSTAFFNEFVSTGFLAAVILALGDDSNAPPGAGMSALVVGLVITALCMAFGYNTGAAMNPSRDFGPRLALLAVGYGGEIFRNGYWVYGPWVATITGAIVGGGLYDIFIFVGGESPINYPRKRIWRAGHKFKKRMNKRIRRQEIPDELR